MLVKCWCVFFWGGENLSLAPNYVVWGLQDVVDGLEFCLTGTCRRIRHETNMQMDGALETIQVQASVERERGKRDAASIAA